jgi:indole-3-glycerol phosphate synthase
MPPFVERLVSAATPVIMELKRSSAEGEDLFRGRSARELVETYERLGAPCLSVVTGSWFGGDETLLREVAGLTDLPVLRKDFVTTESQVVQASAMGAAAVLLTADLLPASLLARLIDACLRLDLTPFVEVSRSGCIERTAHLSQCVVAVSNKDIRLRERGTANVGRGLALLPEIRRLGPACVVSASGIDSPQLGARLLDAGFDALLVGGGLLRAVNPESWIEALTVPINRSHRFNGLDHGAGSRYKQHVRNDAQAR